MTDERVARSRLKMLPPIRRARLWRLYADDRPKSRAGGRTAGRFLDLWMDGGRAILGAKGSGIGTAAKAAVDMGLLRPMPSAWERRLGRELALAYPGYAAARFFLDEGRALAEAGRAFGDAPLGDAPPGAAARLVDPARRETPGSPGPAAVGGPGVPLLRPFAQALGGGGPDLAAIALPLLPCPSALAPSVLLIRDRGAAESMDGDLLPPVRLASAHRALRELARMSEWYGEELWRKADRRLGPWFERRGPYLYPRAGAEGYGALFEAALSAGVLLSPDPELPSIVPGDFDDGELMALSDALASIKP